MRATPYVRGSASVWGGQQMPGHNRTGLKKTALLSPARRRLTRYVAEGSMSFVGSGPYLGLTRLKWVIPVHTTQCDALW